MEEIEEKNLNQKKTNQAKSTYRIKTPPRRLKKGEKKTNGVPFKN